MERSVLIWVSSTWRLIATVRPSAVKRLRRTDNGIMRLRQRLQKRGTKVR